MGDFTKPASDYRDMPIVQQHINAAADMAARATAADFCDEMNYRLGSSDAGWDEGTLEFDSPLEVIFFVWWRAALRTQPLLRPAVIVHRHCLVKAGEQSYNLDFVLA
jgi:hypothetical protein